MFNQAQGALGGILSQGNIPENADLRMIASVFEVYSDDFAGGRFYGIALAREK